MKTKKMFINFVVIFIMIVTVMPVLNVAFADSQSGYYDPSSSGEDPFWEKAGSWFKDVQEEGKGNVSPISIDVINKFMDIVNYVGTVLIIIATMFLGVKYVFGSVDGKADVKESLVTLLVACIFFFGWQYIRDIVLLNGTELIIADSNDVTYKSMFARLLAIVTMIVKVAAIAGVIYVGVRYIFSGAGGRAELKDKSAYFIIGIILTFCSVTVLTVFSNALKDLLE